MADIELVIKIDEKIIQQVKHYHDLPYDDYVIRVAEAIANGTPLPKGHGDLVDRDAVNDKFYEIWQELKCYSNQPTYKELLDRWSGCLDTAPTIIEADAESEGEHEMS